MNDFITWLKDIGASNIEHDSDSISFVHSGKKIELSAKWCNDQTADLDSEITLMDDIYTEGWDDYSAGKGIQANPYESDETKSAEWIDGYNAAMTER